MNKLKVMVLCVLMLVGMLKTTTAKRSDRFKMIVCKNSAYIVLDKWWYDDDYNNATFFVDKKEIVSIASQLVLGKKFPCQIPEGLAVYGFTFPTNVNPKKISGTLSYKKGGDVLFNDTTGNILYLSEGQVDSLIARERNPGIYVSQQTKVACVTSSFPLKWVSFRKIDSTGSKRVITLYDTAQVGDKMFKDVPANSKYIYSLDMSQFVDDVCNIEMGLEWEGAFGEDRSICHCSCKAYTQLVP